ncbi:MAG: gamma-glutamyl-gamma-aminobutyrate hydrolase family protein [Deltaproteobacteria bacterium]|nr:gamma-glutamyl-gamma-aminobutyrate hydrolase family protein [Deltaproteobacteria bacterium]
MRERIRIGLSCCIFHEDRERLIFNGRPLLYVEESMPHYLMAKGALVSLLPTMKYSSVSYRDLIQSIDGLVLHSGVDMAPESYGEKPLKREWAGDRKRDEYELSLVKEALALDVPVLGICRGAQLINVAQGGSLYQDINTQLEGKRVHRDARLYEKNRHRVNFTPGSTLSKVYPGISNALINSVHHQAIKELGRSLKVEALSEDGIVEAVRFDPENPNAPFCWGVQWHPEFQDTRDRELLDPFPILEYFMAELRKRKKS